MKQNTSDNTKVQSEKIPVIIKKKKSTNIINNGRLCIVHAPCESNWNFISFYKFLSIFTHPNR